jgi:CRISPR-associated protein Csm4
MDIVPKKVLQKFQQTLLNPAALFTALYEDTTYTSILKADEGQTTAVVQHNTIDRVLGSVRRGGLYTQEDTFFDPASTVFEIYLKTSLFSKAELIKLFRFISIEGFGRDGSTGKGHFEFSIDEGISLPEAEKPNAFMTLSSYIPTVNDPVKGYYGIVHKYGKLGGLYARGIDEVRGNPFKVPIIMFSAGSTFFDQSYHKDKIYGGLIGAVHQNEHIRHYAYAFPLGVNIEEKYENL